LPSYISDSCKDRRRNNCALFIFAAIIVCVHIIVFSYLYEAPPQDKEQFLVRLLLQPMADLV
jgi:hypothetical protein